MHLGQAGRLRLMEISRIRMVETAAPVVPAGERVQLERIWADAVRANPSLFDGPVVMCTGLEREGADGLLVSWARTTYRHFALRDVPGATSWRPALWAAAAQPTSDGRLLVGRMSSSTSAPGRWQVPGGSVEPPEPGESLDLAALRRHAARELFEEIGVVTAADELALWLVTHGRSVGVLFRAAGLPAEQLHERFAAHTATETALGRDPELDRIAFVGSSVELAELAGPHADHLMPVVRHHLG